MAFPTEDEFLTYFDRLSNWGRWGADDRLGTLNLITEKRRVHAASLVETGKVVSLARDMDPEDADPLARGTVLNREMQLYPAERIAENFNMAEGELPRFGGVRERIDFVPHGSHTHLDGLAHMSWQGMNYNAVPVTAVDEHGSAELSVHHASEGFITRGVLLDIPALTDRTWLDPGHAVSVAELEAAEARQGVQVGEGDALLLYTGNFKRIRREGLHPEKHHPGYSAEALPWLHERGVAVISSDNINDTNPSGFAAKDLALPVHCVALVAMGLWMVDNMELDELAAVCEEHQRWTFLFTMLPWRFVGITGSPVNPVAVF